MKCLVIGAGGVGGSLAALLALAGNEVTCVARGEHKEKMLAHGLRFHSGIKGEQVVPCYVYDGTEERPISTRTVRAIHITIKITVKIILRISMFPHNPPFSGSPSTSHLSLH